MQWCVPSSPFEDSFEAFRRWNGLEEDMETLGLTKEGSMMNQGPLLIVINSCECCMVVIRMEGKKLF